MYERGKYEAKMKLPVLLLAFVITVDLIGAEVSFHDTSIFHTSGATPTTFSMKTKDKISFDSYVGGKKSLGDDRIQFTNDLGLRHCCYSSYSSTYAQYRRFGESYIIKGNRLGKNGDRRAVNVSTSPHEGISFYSEVSKEGVKNWSAYSIDFGVTFSW